MKTDEGESDSDPPPERPPQLEPRQLEVWRILRTKSTEKYALANWYFGALSALRDNFNPDRLAQSAHSLRELLEKIPRALQTEESGVSGDQLKRKRQAVRAALDQEKTNFSDGWRDKVITEALSNVLQEIEQYFDLCDRPDRKEQVFSGLTKLDPMIQTLPEQLRQEKRQRYLALWAKLEGFAHHGGKKDEQDFTECVAQTEDLVFDLMAPISSDDQTLLSGILGKGEAVSLGEIERALRLIERRGANFAFFFKNVSERAWLEPLKNGGYFKDPPGIAAAGEGFVSFPIWWPGVFLKRVAASASEEVLRIISEMGDTDNPRVMEDVVDIALNISDTRLSLKLESVICAYVEQPYHVFEDNVTTLIAKWAASGPDAVEAALRLCEHLIFFRPDPLQKEKQARAEKDADDWMNSLNPAPRFQEWEYQQILDKGVQPLANAAPLQTAKLLIRAVADMVRLETGKPVGHVDWRDASEIWASRVDERERPYSNSQGDLIAALTHACERTFEKGEQNGDHIRELDNTLREGRWWVFDRIRFHLYAQYPSLAKGWISEEILNYAGYAGGRYGFEFQRMIRISTEQLGQALLSEIQLTGIFESIFNGPDKDEYKEFMGDQFSEEAYVGRKRYFQLRHFRPFASVLFGKYKELYDQLCAENPQALTDDDFIAYHGGESKTGASRSARSVAELAALTDDELVSFLNDWEDVHRDPEQWWIDIDFDGLGTALQQLIAAAPSRFLNWGERWHTLKRPVYFRYVFDLATKRIGEHHEDLARWLELADWIMAQSDGNGVAEKKTSETSRDNPDWDSARRQVVDFVGACIGKDVNIESEWRPRIIEVLKAACVAPDPFLDRNREVVTPRDYLTDAINTTRGRALENLVAYGYWVRRREGGTAEVPEIFELLELRFASSPKMTYPECSLVAMNFNRLYGLNSSWTRDNVGNLFPQSDSEAWQIAFGTYLHFNRAHSVLFDILRPQLEFALDNLRLWKSETNRRADPVAHLGEHLLDYFLLGRIPLDGKESPLQRFYNRTTSKEWGHLFDHLGRQLKNTNSLSDEASDRCKIFFESRLRAATPEELKEFTFWLEAECLDAEWRLRALSRTLDVTKGRNRSASMLIERLGKLLAEHPDLVVECLAKLTEGALTLPHFYLQPEQVKPILKVGLSSGNGKTVETAKFALENLLRAGRSEFLNLDAIKDDPTWL